MKFSKIGLIGVGNMGTAILEGLLRKHLVKSSQMIIFDKVDSKSQQFARRWKVTKVNAAADILKECSVILLAVKPQDLSADFLSGIKGIHASQVIISILAGTSVKKIQRIFGKKACIVRAMPNLGAKVGQAVTALTSTSAKGLKQAEYVFSGCGTTLRLPEKQFDLVTAISGSGPAYFFYLMELLIEAGQKRGLSQGQARSLVVQTALGASLLAGSGNLLPGELRKMVTSKKGTTEAALKIFMKAHFSQTVDRAVEAACRRGRELSRK